jgi:hypothetical protein
MNLPAFSANRRIGGRSGQERIRTSEVERQRIYSPPHLAALEPALLKTIVKAITQRETC